MGKETNHSTMNKCGWMDWEAHEILNMALDETELGFSRYFRLSAIAVSPVPFGILTLVTRWKNITDWPVSFLSLRSFRFSDLRMCVQADSNKPKRKVPGLQSAVKSQTVSKMPHFMSIQWNRNLRCAGGSVAVSSRKLLLNLEFSRITVFTSVICAHFSSLAAEKSGCVKYADLLWLFRISLWSR
jgi:hypothetical protein